MLHQPITAAKASPKWASPALEALYRAVEAEKDRLWGIASEEDQFLALDTLLEATETLDIAIGNAGWLPTHRGSLGGLSCGGKA